MAVWRVPGITACLTGATVCAGAAAANSAGPWCDAQDTERMWIEPQIGIRFNEHTRCIADPAPILPLPAGYSAQLDCRNIYISSVREDNSVDVDVMPMSEIHTITLAQHDPNSLIVTLNQNPAIPMVHCHSLWPN